MIEYRTKRIWKNVRIWKIVENMKELGFVELVIHSVSLILCLLFTSNIQSNQTSPQHNI